MYENGFELNNGVKIPAIGYGTFPFHKELLNLVPIVIKHGYRMFDTAWMYHNEKVLGEALKNCGVKRDELFITSKVNVYQVYWGKWHHKLRSVLPPYKSVKRAYQESCNNLGLEYLDLYLVHYPYPNFERYWEQMSVLYENGLVRAVGVSSFQPDHLKKLKNVSDVVPAVNQIEMSPYQTNKVTFEYCRDKGIHVEAFSPFGRGLVTKELMAEPVLNCIAKNYNKSVAQIILRWLYQLGIDVLPRSGNEERIKENISFFDFELTPHEIEKIESLNRNINTVNGTIHR